LRKNFDFFRVAQIFSATLNFSVSKSLARSWATTETAAKGAKRNPLQRKINRFELFSFPETIRKAAFVSKRYNKS